MEAVMRGPGRSERAVSYTDDGARRKPRPRSFKQGCYSAGTAIATSATSAGSAGEPRRRGCGT